MSRVFKDPQAFGFKVADFAPESEFKLDMPMEEALPEEEEPKPVEIEFSLEDKIRQDAYLESEKIINAARMSAEEIVAEAKEYAEKIKEQAYSSGVEVGEKDGYAKGIAQAMLAGEESMQKEMQKLAQIIAVKSRELEMEKEKMLALYIDDLKEVAISIGEKIVQTSLRSSKDVIERMVLSATEKMKKTAWAKIYIGKGEQAVDIQADSEFLKSISRIADNVKVVIMEEEPGTCIVETPDGIIDISVKTQLENIREILSGAVK